MKSSIHSKWLKRASHTCVCRFTPVNKQWQRTACHNLGLRLVRKCDVDEGGPDVPLTRPHRVRHIDLDGNCLFRSLSYIITGTESQD